MVAGATHDDVLDRGELIEHIRQQRDERLVDKDHLVLGMVDHVDQLLGEQANIERVQHGSHAGHGEVGLHVSLVVPHECADAITRPDAQPV